MSSHDLNEVNPGDPVRRVSERISVDAPLERVWSIVCDVNQMPGLHPQMLSARWLDGASEAELGVRFESENVAVDFGVWQAVSRIVEYRPGRSIAWTIEGPVPPPTVCRFDLVRDPDTARERTVVRQTYFFDTRPGAAPPVDDALAYRPA